MTDDRQYPAALTSYDFLKFTALALMIVDHVGAFFLPEYEWLRVMGRFSAPIWLFLVGYARSRDFSARMWIGIGLLTLTNIALGTAILPVTILATILICRFAIDPVMALIARMPASLYPVTAIVFVLTFFTMPLFEYGTITMLVVMAGYMVRNLEFLPFTKSQLLQFVVIVAGLYGAEQFISFLEFDLVQRLVVGFGMLALLLSLTKFQPVAYKSLTEKLPSPLVWIIQFGGRRTLELYVGHFILFRLISVALSDEKIAFFNFHIF